MTARLFHAIKVLLLVAMLSQAMTILRTDAAGATMSLAASKRSVNVGDTFTVSALLATGGASINAASARITFEPTKLAVTGVSRGGSVFTLWAEEPAYSNSAGVVSASGGLPTPGYSGNGGMMMRITFRALAAGTTTVRYASGAMLANDGLGTNIVAGLDTESIAIQERPAEPEIPAQPKPPSATSPSSPAVTPSEPTVPTPKPGAPVITSLSHPQQEAWYRDNRPTLIWEVRPGVEGVSVLVDQKPDSEAPPTSIGLSNFYTVKEPLSDGVWFGHVRLRTASGWGPTGHRMYRIDTTPPEVTQSRVLSRGGDERVLEFAATDASSGVSRVAISLDGQQLSAQATSPFTLPTLRPGDHLVELTAVDHAGNQRVNQVFVSVLSAAQTPLTLISNPVVIALGFMNLIFMAFIVLLEYRYHHLMASTSKRRRPW